MLSMICSYCDTLFAVMFPPLTVFAVMVVLTVFAVMFVLTVYDSCDVCAVFGLTVVLCLLS